MTRVVMRPQAIQSVLESQQGPVFRHAARVAQQVKAGARRQVGVSRPDAGFTGRGQGKHLRDSIVTRYVRDAKGAAIYVGSELPHARPHHEGTRPHRIEPRRAKALRFVGGDGRVVFALHVDHPGTRPNPFLVDAARKAGLKVRLR